MSKYRTHEISCCACGAYPDRPCMQGSKPLPAGVFHEQRTIAALNCSDAKDFLLRELEMEALPTGHGFRSMA